MQTSVKEDQRNQIGISDHESYLNSANRGKGLAVFYKVVVDKVIEISCKNGF